MKNKTQKRKSKSAKDRRFQRFKNDILWLKYIKIVSNYLCLRLDIPIWLHQPYKNLLITF